MQTLLLFPVLPRVLKLVTFFSLFLFVSEHSSAISSTSVVAVKGQPAFVSGSWPKGVGALVNDPSRTWGLNPWFSEWPNDVNHYGFQIKSTDEMNRLIAKLVAVKSDRRRVHLSINKEPGALGFTTRVPKGNTIAAMFTIGDQTKLDQWYKNLSAKKPLENPFEKPAAKQFGVMKLKEAPVARPPTLTIFVQNEVIKLSELKIPKGVEVSIVDVPTALQQSDKTIKKDMKLDDDRAKALTEIKKFLELRAAEQDDAPKP